MVKSEDSPNFHLDSTHFRRLTGVPTSASWSDMLKGRPVSRKGGNLFPTSSQKDSTGGPKIKGLPYLGLFKGGLGLMNRAVLELV